MALTLHQSKDIAIANNHGLLQSTQSLSTDTQHHTSVFASSPSNTFKVFQNAQESIKCIEYDLIMNSRDLADVSLVQKLFQSNSQATLFNLLDGIFVAQAPSSYIQEIRSIYYLLIYIGIYPQHLIKSSPNNPSKFLQISDLTNTCITRIQSAFMTLKLEIYKNNKISRQHKKYAAQFFEFLKFDINKLNEEEATNNAQLIHQIITSNINKYPVIDEIFIEVFIIHLITKQNLPNLSTIDDNYNIALVLKSKFRIECEFLMFREFVIQGEIEGLMVDCGFYLKKYTHYIEQLTNHLLVKQEEVVYSNKAILLDVSRTKQYTDQVFNDAEKSYIFELSDVSEENQQNNLATLKPVSPLKMNLDEKRSQGNQNIDQYNQRFIKGRSMMTISASYSIKDISPIQNPALKSNIIEDSKNCQANVTSLEDCISNSKLIKLARNVSGVSIEKNIELPRFTDLNSPTNSVELNVVNATGNYLPKYNSQHQTKNIVHRPPTKDINQIQYRNQIKIPSHNKPPLAIPNNPQIFKHPNHHRISNHQAIRRQQKHVTALKNTRQISNNIKTQYHDTKTQFKKETINITQTENNPVPYQRPSYQPQSMKLTELRPNIMNTQPNVSLSYKSIQEIPRSKISIQPKHQINLQNRHHKNQINNHTNGNPARQYQSHQIQNVGRPNYPIINPQFHQTDKIKMNWGTPKNQKIQPYIRLNNQRPLYKL